MHRLDRMQRLMDIRKVVIGVLGWDRAERLTSEQEQAVAIYVQTFSHEGVG